MATQFFEPSSRFCGEHIALYDFTHAATVALWNTRWQVRGFLEALPHAKVEDLNARFVRGSGVSGVNVKRTFDDWSWDQHTHEVAKVTLANTIALFEGWIDGMCRLFPEGHCRRFQFPSQGVRNRGQAGIGDALAALTAKSKVSQAMATSVTPELRSKRNCKPGELDELLVTFRYFKELRNSFIHAGGVASQRAIDAEADYATTSAAMLRMREAPQYIPATLGEPLELSLRGVIGLGAVVLSVVETLDAELSQTTVAEAEFVRRFRSNLGIQNIPTTEPRKSTRVRGLTQKLGLPRPQRVSELLELLATEGLVR